ncbi:hypothetical protein [Nostoc sp.]
MQSRQYSQTKNTQKQTSAFSIPLVQEMFESRPFVVQQTADNLQQPDIKTALQRAKRYGHSITKVVNTEQLQGQGKNRTTQPAIQCKASDRLPKKLKFSTQFPFLRRRTTPATPTPVAPTPVARTSAAPTPVAPTPAAPTSAAPTPAKKGSFDDALVAERRKQDVARQRPDLTPQIFKRDFMKESTDLADDTIAGKRRGRGGQTLGFHVTRGENLPSILSTGLDPNKGGKGGASELRAETNYENASKGYIHYSDNTYLSGFYGNEMGNHKPNLLGIRRPEQIGRDPDEPRGAYRTNQKILPTDVTNLGEKATNKAIGNYGEAENRRLDKLNANTEAGRAANRIPNSRREEKSNARRQANEERTRLHFQKDKFTGPQPFPDESIDEDISKNV